MSENDKAHTANVGKIKKWSPVWIIPLVTLFIGLWIIFYYVNARGPTFTMVIDNAEGIVANKTAIKSRSVDIGMVESVALSSDLNQVQIVARLNKNMKKLLNKETVFWVVKPQIGREGVSGLGTLLSGVYIELLAGNSEEERSNFQLRSSPPPESQETTGLHLSLTSKNSATISASDPVLFRGVKVGSVESSRFDTEKKLMYYEIFVKAPYERLVTTNVRFWQDSGVSFEMSAKGVNIQLPSLQTLLRGGVSFDTPEGWSDGVPVTDRESFELFGSKSAIQESLYTKRNNFLLFFSDSIKGLHTGAAVEFRGVRIGTVVEVPYFVPRVRMSSQGSTEFTMPVLISIEPDRLRGGNENNEDELTHKSLVEFLIASQKDGLRAALKSGNLLTGALYVEFDFHNNVKKWKEPETVYEYTILATTSMGLNQLQNRLDSIMDEVRNTLVITQDMLKTVDQAVLSIDKLIANKDMQTLPLEIKKMVGELEKVLKGFQPGSQAYNLLMEDMKRLDEVLREAQPLIRTLNDKSNALIFSATEPEDPKPKKAKK